MRAALTLIALVVAIAGCGYKTPLSLPAAEGQKPKPEAQKPKPVPPQDSRPDEKKSSDGVPKE